MKKYSKYVRGVCGLLITALLIGVGGYLINENTALANASLNDDLAAIESKLDGIESQEAVIKEEFENLPYLKSSDLVVEAVTNDNITLEKKSYVNNISMDVSKEGYTAIAVVGYRICNTAAEDGNGWTYIGLSDYYLTVRDSKDKLIFSVGNRGTENAKFRLMAYVLYVKNL